MRLTFWGAAQRTTGSFHLLETNGSKIALDCGLYQGRRAEARELSEEFPVAPSEVSALLLSHAHIDHIGNLPTFGKQGFNGDVFATHATVDLARVLLMDSAFIQEKDAQFMNKILRRRKEESVKPLYTIDDAENIFPLFVGKGYYRPLQVNQNIEAKFLEAGHILGSAILEMDVTENGNKRRVVFSGDIGRGRNAILRNPEIPSDADYLIMESTYGARNTERPEDLRGRLEEMINRVAKRGGKIIIPAFSVGRTQEIVYQLNILFNEERIPRIPCFVDSPLSNNVTQVFRAHPECFNRPIRDVMMNDPNPFGFETMTYTENVEESKKLNGLVGPCIIISASGMCEAGRILHHLRNNVEDHRNLILIVGYQAEHTLGRRIVEKREEIKIFGQMHRLNAEVEVMDGFSAHADSNELKDFAFRVMERGNKLRKIFLVHGEPEQQQPLAEYLEKLLKVEVLIPKRGQQVELN